MKAWNKKFQSLLLLVNYFYNTERETKYNTSCGFNPYYYWLIIFTYQLNKTIETFKSILVSILIITG